MPEETGGPRPAAAVKPPRPKNAVSKTGSASRTVASFAPLAVALAAGAVMHRAPSPTTAAPATSVTTAAAAKSSGSLAPLLKAGQGVDWWFVFKFNSAVFGGCTGTAQRTCPFGGSPQPYKHFGQQFAYASSADHNLQQGGGCVGDTTTDPVGATFDEVYNGSYHYVVWNDQFYGNPMNTEFAPDGHSKGMVAWDDTGKGLVMQVSTPSWPGSGSASHARQNDGNTLGCIKDDDVLVSQHFFSMKLTKDGVIAVLMGIANASVVTDPKEPSIVNNGGPAEIQALTGDLGNVSTSRMATITPLSSTVQLISKPSKLEVPPWQMVSAMLGGEPLRVASWWTRPEIPTASAGKPMCWDSSLGTPGAVEIATSGTWSGTTIGLEGVDDPDGNHAKVGVSNTASPKYAIFGDMNQQGALSGKCGSSQNGRGGLFYVVNDAALAASVSSLIKGDTAPK